MCWIYEQHYIYVKFLSIEKFCMRRYSEGRNKKQQMSLYFWLILEDLLSLQQTDTKIGLNLIFFLFSGILTNVPDDECIIAPIVEVLAPARTQTSAYILKIPHCLDEGHDRSKVMVRMLQENRQPAVVEVPPRDKCTDGVLFYDIDLDFIDLHTPHFCTIISSYKEKICLDSTYNFFFGNFHTEDGSSEVNIRPYLCNFLHARIQDFRQVGRPSGLLMSTLTAYLACTQP